MLKRFILILLVCLLSVITCIAKGQLQEVNTAEDNVFLYLYTKDCHYCTQVQPVFNKIKKKYENKVKFIKMNANLPDGFTLMTKFKATYVPFVVLISNKSRQYIEIPTQCLIEYACVDHFVDSFTK